MSEALDDGLISQREYDGQAKLMDEAEAQLVPEPAPQKDEAADRDELNQLRREMDLNSLGDRPHSMSAAKLRRLMELEAAESLGRGVEAQKEIT